jgi:hypothetical protein
MGRGGHIPGKAARNGLGGNILHDHCSGRYHRTVSNGHAGTGRGVGPNPDVPADFNGVRMQVFPVFRVHLMIQRCQHHVVADEAPFSDGDSALVLEVTAGIDKHIILHHDVLSRIRVKRREQGKGPINRSVIWANSS